MTHTYRDSHFSSWASVRSFWLHRFLKMYPTYILFVVLDFVLKFAYNGSSGFFPEAIRCQSLQVLMLSALADCRATILNYPSWYITVLWWLWLAFPLVHKWIIRFGGHSPCAKIAALQVVALISQSAMLQHVNTSLITTLPVLRALEFLMGAVAALHVQTLLPWKYPAAAAACLLLIHVFAFYAQGRENYDESRCESMQLIGLVPSSPYCIVGWLQQHINCQAFLWTSVVHHLASSELLDVPGRVWATLEKNDLLRTINTFSLQIYLGHVVIYELIVHRMGDAMDLTNEWDMDTVILAVYSTCYAIKIWVIPHIERAMQSVSCIPHAHPRTLVVTLQQIEMPNYIVTQA